MNGYQALQHMSELAQIEVVTPGSTRDLYEEALADRLVTDRDAAKALIAERIKEIDRLKALLARAERGLEDLLEKDVTEVAAIADQRSVNTGLLTTTTAAGPLTWAR